MSAKSRKTKEPVSEKPSPSHNVNPLFLVIAGVVLLVLVFTVSFLDNKAEDDSIGLTGYVLGSAPGNASVLDVYIQNVSRRINGSTRQFTALRFVAFGGGWFNATNATGASLRLRQFYLVLYNRSANAAPYLGRIVYNSGHGWVASNLTGSLSFPGDIRFNHTVWFNTSNRTQARQPLSPIMIHGFVLYGSSSPWSSGDVEIVDSVTATHSGLWRISFDYQLSRYSPGFGASIGSRRVEYVLSAFGAPSVHLPVQVGFKSPAEVNLSNLNRYEMRLIERPNPAATLFNFTCNDPDGNNTATGSSVSLIYHSGYTYEVRRDSCSYNSTSAAYFNNETLCSTTALPANQYYPIYARCPAGCNAEGTACAS